MSRKRLWIFVAALLFIGIAMESGSSPVKVDSTPYTTLETGIIAANNSMDVHFKVCVANDCYDNVTVKIFASQGRETKQIGKKEYHPLQGNVTTFTIINPENDTAYQLRMSTGGSSSFRSIEIYNQTSTDNT